MTAEEQCSNQLFYWGSQNVKTLLKILGAIIPVFVLLLVGYTGSSQSCAKILIICVRFRMSITVSSCDFKTSSVIRVSYLKYIIATLLVIDLFSYFVCIDIKQQYFNVVWILFRHS